MSKQNTNENRSKYGNLGFYLVLALCTAMIGVSCWFAYTQTADNLSLQLDSALESVGDLAAAKPETNVPKSTERAETRSTQPMISMQTTAASAAAATTAETSTTTVPASSKEKPVYPIVGEVIGAYSNGELVKSATTGVWQTHNGIDIAAQEGTQVCAMAAGEIAAVTEDPLWGVCVTIDHGDGCKSRYCNLDADLEVNTGDKVECGSIIGTVGKTADAESGIPAHLHFEVLQGDRFVDPEGFIKGN